MAKNSNCQICNRSKSRYSCPKCNILYCSLACYQSEDHLQCSEMFYWKCIQEELKNEHCDLILKNKMLKILKQENSMSDSECCLDSDDDESIPDLAQRMFDINLNDEEVIWKKLIPEERNEFRKLISTGNIIKILPDWEPWWKTRKRKILIQEYEENFDWRSLCPEVLKNIPELSSLTTVKPSPKVPFLLLNVLMSYAFTTRWFKGMHLDMPVESISTCIALSAALRNTKIMEDSVEAFMAFESDLLKCNWVDKSHYDRTILQSDLADIIKTSDSEELFYCVKAVLSDFIVLCSKAMNFLKNEKNRHCRRFSDPPPKVTLIQQISKKMIYYLSWTEINGTLLVKLL